MFIPCSMFINYNLKNMESSFGDTLICLIPVSISTQAQSTQGEVPVGDGDGEECATVPDLCLCTMALNARPSLQLVVKLWTLTLGYLRRTGTKEN